MSFLKRNSFLSSLFLLALVTVLSVETHASFEAQASSGLAASDVDPRAYWYNRQGAQALATQDYAQALRALGKALGFNPSSGEIHYNLGLTFHALGQVEKAEASYRLALKNAASDRTRFQAHFNLAIIATAAKDYDAALAEYQSALRYEPESLETKINIELLMMQQQQDQQKQDQQKKDQEQKEGDQDKDKKDGKGDGQDQKDKKEQDPKDEKGDQEKPEEDKSAEDQKAKGEYEKPKPQEFKSQELTPSDVNKILDEIRQQEQRIRAEFQRKESKDRPRGKSW